MDESKSGWITWEHQRLISNAGYTDEMIGLASSFQRDLNVVYHTNFIFTSYPPGLKLSIPIPDI